MKRQETVNVKKDDNCIIVKVNLSATIEKAEKGNYVVYCPSLKLCSQGKTHAEAKKRIMEMVDLFIESCVAHKELGETLINLGFKKLETLNRAERRRMQRRPSAKNAGKVSLITFPVELPLPLAA